MLALAAIGVPLAANAGAPSGQITVGADLFCESEAGFLGIHVQEDEYGSFLDIYYESFDGPPLFGFTEEFEFDGFSLSADVEMLDEGSGPVGIAVIDATLDPVGEPETYEDRFRDGNRWVEIRDVYQDAAPAGSVEGVFDFDLSECEGMTFVNEFWSTNPNAFVGRFEGRYLGCGLEGSDGFGHLFADSSDWGEFMEVFIVPPEGPALVGFTEEVTFTDTELSGVVDLFEEEGESPEENGNGGPVAQAIVEAMLESSGFFINDLIFQNDRFKTRVETFDVTGSVAVNGSEFEMVECHAEAYAEMVWSTNPNGPKPTGPTPGNDTPEGAESLDARTTVNAQTKATAPAPEAACVFVFDYGEGPEEFPIPIGKTLWYSFEGTGDPVTVDSAGSNFDTVMGIYDAGLNQLACVDDVGGETGWSLQAAATVDTVEGVTYLVQVGGFGFFDDPEYPSMAEFGRIRLRTS